MTQAEAEAAMLEMLKSELAERQAKRAKRFAQISINDDIRYLGNGVKPPRLSKPNDKPDDTPPTPTPTQRMEQAARDLQAYKKIRKDKQGLQGPDKPSVPSEAPREPSALETLCDVDRLTQEQVDRIMKIMRNSDKLRPPKSRV